jgi:hypothetical protein
LEDAEVRHIGGGLSRRIASAVRIAVAGDEEKEVMPKAKPISLYPLTFHEALKAIISVDPDRVGITSKRRLKTVAKAKRDKRKVKQKNR